MRVLNLSAGRDVTTITVWCHGETENIEIPHTIQVEATAILPGIAFAQPKAIT